MADPSGQAPAAPSHSSPNQQPPSHSDAQPSTHHHTHSHHSRSRSKRTSFDTPTEDEPLLRHQSHHELADQPMYCCSTTSHLTKPVYTNIHRIRRDIIFTVEDYLSLEQLRDVRLNVSVVRPLVDKFYELDDISIVYCLLVNRVKFLQEQAHLTNRRNVYTTRATLCELIATRILRRFDEDNKGSSGLLLLAQILVAGFQPFQGAPGTIQEEAADAAGWMYRKTLPALEVAIIGESKLFLSSTSCQKVIDGIYEGRIIFTPSSFLDLVPDRYKQKPISLYDPRAASILNQYRLIVPRTRNILEIVQFLCLLVLYLAFMAERDASRLSWLELAFSVYAFGWVLDQFATILEHGWHVYTQNLWSFLDVTFTAIYWVYLVLRIHGWRTGSIGPAQQSLDVLAIGAPVLIPRLAFNLLSNNLLFVSLRDMMANFTMLTALAAWCFAGFLLSLYWLGEGAFSPITLGMWMLWIWFGLDGTGVRMAPEFHWFLGPCLMVTFAFLGNTLFLTILVSMLSNTFSSIVSNAAAEIQFRHAVLTLEGVKSDAIFAYQPPFNIVALFILVPLKFIVSPRWFHKIHVTGVRIINLPLLLVIALAERRHLWSGPNIAGTDFEVAAKRESQWFWEKWRITTHGDIFAVFDLVPPEEIEPDIAVDDEMTHNMIRRQFTRTHTSDALKQRSEARRQSQAHNRTQPPQDPPVTPKKGGAGEDRPQTHSRESSKDRPPVFPGTLSRNVTGVGIGSGSNGTVSKPGSRRDSMAPFPGLRQEIRGILDDSEAVSDLTHRLESLEACMSRIESMLGVLVGDSSSSSNGSEDNLSRREEEDGAAEGGMEEEMSHVETGQDIET